MWDTFPYLGNAASAVLIFVLYRTNDCLFPLSAFLKGDLPHNWATIASKNVSGNLSPANLRDDEYIFNSPRIRLSSVYLLVHIVLSNRPHIYLTRPL